MSAVDVLAVLEQAHEILAAEAKHYRLQTSFADSVAEARAAVAELIEAGNAAHMALIGYLPEHRNAVTSCAIARIEAALARCGAGS